jgi:hypothetical protein
VDLGICKSDHLIAFGFQPSCAHSIILDLVGGGVGVAINLNDEFGFQATEVGDKAADRMLTADLKAQLTVAYACPHPGFGRGERMPQVA